MSVSEWTAGIRYSVRVMARSLNASSLIVALAASSVVLATAPARAVDGAAPVAHSVAADGGTGTADAEPAVRGSDHETALAALARGEIKPLDEILATLRLSPAESFLGVGFDRAGGRWIYEMTLLTAGGRYRVVTVDAANATIIKEELR